MRRNTTLSVLAMAAAIVAVGSTSAPAAAANNDRYCLQGPTYGYPGNCQFSSFEQCRATASGTNEGCGVNPMRAAAARPQRIYR
jgi:uncharacterized protein DUF3551